MMDITTQKKIFPALTAENLRILAMETTNYMCLFVYAMNQSK
ncbi:MAG TPA: hypothetical protein PKV43_06330 [Armatimonadota bacterium]|nr:hypothetical protein [Armatimonadota bacterium]